MASDPRYFLGNARVPFHDIATSADASGNGIEVTAAVAGATLYAMGFVYHNAAVGALTITLSHTAGAGGVTAIGAPILVGAGATVVVNYTIPLSASAVALNLGVVASGAGQIEVELWGYQSA